MPNAPAPNLELAQRSLERVLAKIDAVDSKRLSRQNLNIFAAVSLALGVCPIVLAYRDQAILLPGFDIEYVDNLSDYALAVWFLNLTAFSLPRASHELDERATRLRRKLLSWAKPLVESGLLAREDFAQIRRGFGAKDAAGDLVALAALYRSAWSEIQGVCGVTEADLEEAGKIGTAVFTTLSQRQNQAALPPSEDFLRRRKAWTLLDKAYRQCHRAVAYFRYDERDADILVPPMRRNCGLAPADRARKRGG